MHHWRENTKQNTVTKCSKKKTGKIGSILSTHSPLKGEISQPGTEVSDLLACLACSSLSSRPLPHCGALVLAWRRSKLVDNIVAQEPKLTCKAEIPLLQKPTERAPSGGGACWAPNHRLFTYRQSQGPFLMPQEKNKQTNKQMQQIH